MQYRPWYIFPTLAVTFAAITLLFAGCGGSSPPPHHDVNSQGLKSDYRGDQFQWRHITSPGGQQVTCVTWNGGSYDSGMFCWKGYIN